MYAILYFRKLVSWGFLGCITRIGTIIDPPKNTGKLRPVGGKIHDGSLFFYATIQSIKT